MARRLGLAFAFFLLGAAPARADWTAFAQNEVAAITESPDGRIWIATRTGAREFDGQAWSTPAPPSGVTEVRRALVDREGNLWIATPDRGVARLGPEGWSVPGDASSLKDLQARTVFEDHAGDVWVGFVNGLGRYRRAEGRWEWLDPSNSGLAHANVEAIVEDGEGALWFASGQAGGVSVLDSTRAPGGWRAETVRPFGLPRDSITTFGRGSDGSIWCASPTSGGLSQHRPDGSWRHLGRAQGLPSDSVTAVAGDARGGVWFGFDGGGIGHFDGRGVRIERTTPGGDPIGPVTSLLVDAGGVLWIGTRSGSLWRSDDVEWRTWRWGPSTCTYTTPAARTQAVLPGDPLCRFADRAGDQWFGTVDAPVALLDTTGAWSSQPELPFNVKDVLEERDGTLDFGSSTAGLVALDRSSGTATPATTLGLGDIEALLEDHAGELWAGGPAGLWRRAAGAWAEFVPLAGQDVRELVEDAGGGLWVRTGVGLWRIAPARDEAHALPGAGAPEVTPSSSLCRRMDGSVWVGLRAGVFRTSGDSLAAVTPAPPTLGTHVQTVREDPFGAMWITTYAGAARFDGTWTEYPSDTPNGSVLVDDRGIVWISVGAQLERLEGGRFQPVGAESGLPSIPVADMWEDFGGHLWFRTACALTEHAPDRAAPQTIVTLAPDSLSGLRDAAFTFGTFGAEEGVVYERRVLDLDPQGRVTRTGSWTELFGSSLALSDIEDGAHRLEARARDRWRNLDPSPATTTWLVDATPPTARITSPPNRGVVDSVTVIEGATLDPRLRRWRLDSKSADSSWSSGAHTLVDWTSVGVLGALGAWDTRTVPDGNYDLRLVSQDELGLEAIGEVTVLVDNFAPFSDVTSPQKLTRPAGGEVWSANGDARLVFQPDALPHDATVTLDGASARPPGLPGLPAPTDSLLRAYSLAWEAARLTHPAILEIHPGAAAAQPLAVYHWDGGGWSRLGSALELSIDMPGVYALARESGPLPGGAATLANLAFSPRVLRAEGESLAISFTLGQAATVNVHVYNRAGRFVRKVASGAFPAGANLVRWDGRNDAGERAPDDLYLVTVDALGQQLRSTVVLSH